MICWDLFSRQFWIVHRNIGFFWPKSRRGPSDDLGRSFGIIISPKFQNPIMFVNHFHNVFSKQKGRTMIQIYKVPRWIGPGRRAGHGGPGPLARGPGPARLPGPVHRPTIKSQKFFKFLFEKCPPLENHEKTTFRAFLETKGPRDLPYVQERQLLFRIALTRVLYDQMAPPLCLFYVPWRRHVA